MPHSRFLSPQDNNADVNELDALEPVSEDEREERVDEEEEEGEDLMENMAEYVGCFL